MKVDSWGRSASQATVLLCLYFFLNQKSCVFLPDEIIRLEEKRFCIVMIFFRKLQRSAKKKSLLTDVVYEDDITTVLKQYLFIRATKHFREAHAMWEHHFIIYISVLR